MRRIFKMPLGLVLPGILAFLLVSTALPAAADHHEKSMEAKKAAMAKKVAMKEAMAAQAASGLAGAGAAYMKSWDDAAEKLKSLAEAMPQEKYSWRPAEGVRSTSETFMHVAGANYFLAKPLGAPMPDGVGPDMEKETDKAKVTATLDKSLAHARAAVQAFDVTKLSDAVEVFGQKMTYGDVLMILSGHLQEHLGQSIAYARMNGVVPPWSVPPPKEEPEAAAEGGR